MITLNDYQKTKQELSTDVVNSGSLVIVLKNIADMKSLSSSDFMQSLLLQMCCALLMKVRMDIFHRMGQ